MAFSVYLQQKLALVELAYLSLTLSLFSSLCLCTTGNPFFKMCENVCVWRSCMKVIGIIFQKVIKAEFASAQLNSFCSNQQTTVLNGQRFSWKFTRPLPKIFWKKSPTSPFYDTKDTLEEKKKVCFLIKPKLALFRREIKKNRTNSMSLWKESC